MSESLRQLQNIQQEHVLRSTESAKGKEDELAPKPRSESDIDTTTDMRMQLESSTDETGPDRDCSELTEIEQSLDHDERMDDPVSEKQTLQTSTGYNDLVVISSKINSTNITDQQITKNLSLKLNR